MSLTLSHEVSREAPWKRATANLPWLAASVLLIGEYLLTSYAVDIRHLAARDDWLAGFGGAGSIGPAVLCIVTATLLIGGRRLIQDLSSALDRAARSRESRSALGRFVALAVHLAGFATFLSFTVFFAGLGESLPREAGFLAAAWIGSIVIALLALVHSIVPLRLLLPIALRGGPVLAVGGLLGFAAWAAGVATVRFWDPLGGLTLHGTMAVLRTFSSDLGFDVATAMLTVEGFSVVISPVCSGYEGIGLLTVLMSAYLWTYRARLRFPHVLALLPIGIALSWTANVLRISALMMIGARWSPEVALGSFHSKAGWVLFCGLALGLVALTRNARMFSRDAEHATAGAPHNPTAAYLMPLLALVGVHMVTGLFSDGFPLFYPLGIVAAAAMIWRYRRAHPWLFRPSWSWEAVLLGAAAFGLWVALEPPHDPAALERWSDGLGALPLPLAALWVSFRALGSVLVVPVVEELAFRGYLLRRFLSSDFTSVSFKSFSWVSLIVSSVAYGLLHERWLAGVLAGVLFAVAQQRGGRLGHAVIAHATANLLLAAHALAWQRWHYWI